MLKHISVLLSFVWISLTVSLAQTDVSLSEEDTAQYHYLDEVIIISKRSLADQSEKPLGSLDNYLERSNVVNLIKRGAYAWEPFINGMASERSVITIDGMRIYAACTDKMDPVTSYVEISNLSKANIHSGSAGSAGGSTIAGGLDLIQKKPDFGPKQMRGSLMSGLELNNMQKILGGSFTYTSPKFYSDWSATYRDAENYKAGGGQEILYSQFSKLNLAGNAGFQLSEHRELEASLIFDNATDVGYPALPMDVSLARAYIASINYTQHHISEQVHLWETKLYYNDVTHIMDDTKRPIVPIRMDMPGWSKTGGFFSKLIGMWRQHDWLINLSGHQNYSYAEMTMYGNNPGEKDMFMLTWPGVSTQYLDLYLNDEIKFNENLKGIFNLGLAVQRNVIKDTFGFQSLEIFYPDLKRAKTRFLKRFSGNMQYQESNWLLNFGLSYGERAPSVSEGYGFYLFNSFDRHDYVGNPDLKNEQSVSFNYALSYGNDKLFTKLSGSYFYIADYIIGIPDPILVPMTINGSGVRVYQSLDHAILFNAALDISYQVLPQLHWNNKLTYRSGVGDSVGYLPMIQPLSYSTDLNFNYNSYKAQLNFLYNAAQSRINPSFGELELPAYYIINLSLSKYFEWGKHGLLLNTGVENLLDKNYTTFADWNRIPRMGRNIFFNVVWNF